jgi:hypothetical protein
MSRWARQNGALDRLLALVAVQRCPGAGGGGRAVLECVAAAPTRSSIHWTCIHAASDSAGTARTAAAETMLHSDHDLPAV